MTTSMPTRLILHPGRTGVPKDTLDQVPLYAVTTGGGVGAQLPGETMTVIMLAFYDFDTSRWAFLPDGRAVVACESSFQEGKYWIERSLLAEDGYEVTTARIDLEAAKIDQAFQATLWKGKQAELLSRKQAVIEHPMTGASVSGDVNVQPGTYPMAGIIPYRLLPNQLAPFSLLILISNTKVAIVPDILWAPLTNPPCRPRRKAWPPRFPPRQSGPRSRPRHSRSGITFPRANG